MSVKSYSETYKKRTKFFVVSGIIGAGKTTLTTQLGEKLNLEKVYEPVKENPYLAKFYEDPAKYGFAMQMFLLNRRFRAHKHIVWGQKDIIQDRSIYEDPIFAKMLSEDNLIEPLDFETYTETFANMINFLRRPDLVIYLDCEAKTAHERIQKRGRECEKGISVEYLESLKKGYESWLKDIEGAIPVVKLDWNEFQSTDDVVKKIQKALPKQTNYFL